MRPGQPLLEGVPREGVRLAGTIGLLLIPFWSAVSAQETIPISARETAPISARETVPMGGRRCTRLRMDARRGVLDNR